MTPFNLCNIFRVNFKQVRPDWVSATHSSSSWCCHQSRIAADVQPQLHSYGSTGPTEPWLLALMGSLQVYEALLQKFCNLKPLAFVQFLGIAHISAAFFKLNQSTNGNMKGDCDIKPIISFFLLNIWATVSQLKFNHSNHIAYLEFLLQT